MSTIAPERRHSRPVSKMDAAECEPQPGFQFAYGDDSLETSRPMGGLVLIDADVPHDPDPSPVEAALSLYAISKNSHALDAFAHPLMAHLLNGETEGVDQLLREVSDRIELTVARVGYNALTREFAELEMWLAAVTLTKKNAAQLRNRAKLIDVLRIAVESSGHIDKKGLLQAIY
jgi:hypothetical protein